MTKKPPAGACWDGADTFSAAGVHPNLLDSRTGFLPAFAPLYTVLLALCRPERQQLHLDFLGVAPDSALRRRSGVYNSHVLRGPNGRSVKLLLLDVRSHRDPWPNRPGGPPREEGDMLGEDQWKWLEAELTNSSADMHLILSGIQVLSQAGGVVVPPYTGESWNGFPTSRARLLGLVLNSGAASPMLLSGDVHFSEVVEERCSSGRGGGAVSVVEFTSSGLTHAWAGPLNWPSSSKFLFGYTIPVFPLVLGYAFRLYGLCISLLGSDPHTKGRYGGLSYGEIDINWPQEAGDSTGKVTLRAIGTDGSVRLSQTYELSSFAGKAPRSERAAWKCAPHGGPAVWWRVAATRALVYPLLVAGVLLPVVLGLFAAVRIVGALWRRLRAPSMAGKRKQQ